MSSRLGDLIDEACGRARGDDRWKVGVLLSALEQIVDTLGDTSFNGVFRLRTIEVTAKAAIAKVKGGCNERQTE